MSKEQLSVSRNLFVGVNEPAGENLSDLEKKHLPVIDAPAEAKVGDWVEVTVQVGRLMRHPNEHGHFIQFIELYADDTFLGRTDLTSVKTCPKVTFCVSLPETALELRAYGHCNMHGTWVSCKPIQVAA